MPVAFRAASPLRLGDVAEVVEGSPPPIGDAVINDGPGLLLDRREAALGQHPRGHPRVEEALDGAAARR